MPLIFLSAFNFLRNSWVGKAVAVAGAIFIALFLARRSGVKAEAARQELADMEFGEDIRDRANETKTKAKRDADSMSHDDLVERLRAKGRLRD